MSATVVQVFDRTLQQTNHWLNLMMNELGTGSRRVAFGALWASLPSWRSLDDRRKLIQNGVPESQPSSTIAALTGQVLWQGVNAAVVLELLPAWNRLRHRPPLGDPEVVEVVGNIDLLRQGEDRAERHSRWPAC